MRSQRTNFSANLGSLTAITPGTKSQTCPKLRHRARFKGVESGRFGGVSRDPQCELFQELDAASAADAEWDLSL